MPKGTASPLACFCLSPTGQSSTHRHVYASCPRHLPRRRLAPAGRSIFEAFLVPTTAPDLQHTPELRHLLTGPFYTSVAVMRASAPRLWCCCRCWPLPMATKQVLAATSRARLPPARPGAGVGTPTHSRTHTQGFAFTDAPPGRGWPWSPCNLSSFRLVLLPFPLTTLLRGRGVLRLRLAECLFLALPHIARSSLCFLCVSSWALQAARIQVQNAGFPTASFSLSSTRSLSTPQTASFTKLLFFADSCSRVS